VAALLELLEGIKSPYYGRVTMGAEKGDVISPEDPKHPQLEVLFNSLTPIKALFVQVLKVRDPESGESAYVRRIVADIGDGREMDIADPVPLDADIAETGIDTTTCAAGCGMHLDAYDMVIIDGKAYHKFCVDSVEDEEEKG